MERYRLYVLVHTLVVLLVVGVAAGGFAEPVAAQDRSGEIRTILDRRDAEIKRLLGTSDATVSPAQRERLRAVINDVIDFAAMGQAALGPHWEELTPAQQADFVTVFGDIVRSQSLSNLDPYRAPVTYESIDASGNRARVLSKTVYKEVEIRIAYDLAFDGTSWKAVDIILDDVSTVEGYSRSFRTMIRKRGFETLMTQLRKKQADVSGS